MCLISLVKRFVFGVFLISLFALLLTSRCSLNSSLSDFAQSLTTESNAVPEEALEFLPLVEQRASRDLGRALDKIEIKKVEYTIWPNSCLGVNDGLPYCGNQITDGFKVVLQVKGNSSLKVRYHVSRDGKTIILVP